MLKKMDTYQGDLTDIIRAGGSNHPPAEAPAIVAAAVPPEWHFPNNAINYSSACPVDDFGDPFAHLRDPMIDTPQLSPGIFFHSSDAIKAAGVDGGFVGNISNNNLGHKILDDHHEMKRPPNIFSRMLQISPTAKLPLSPPCDSHSHSPVVVAAPLLVGNEHTLISPSNSKGCLVESSLQISSPRNTGIRRRKSQAKKVVCIPAPAPANSRPSSGEVVPSDLWAWRKYGQKPIKGSPFPRGYYRCSSSKGCSARKQVERSRTDPNMLVITYTSEHNHPWPTQRNALAGSTRSQPSKSTAAAAGKTSPKSNNQKEEQQKETSTENTNTADVSSSAAVKLEEVDDQEFDNNINNQMEMAGEDVDVAAEFDDGYSQSYKPALPEPIIQNEDSFFADLGEIEADSLDMLFTQGFDHGRDGKGLDPFGFYDWAAAAAVAGSSNTAAPSSGGATTSNGDVT